MPTKQIIVSGKVQGVFYRVSTKKRAGELGLSGLVRNLENGNVEIIATGGDNALNELVNWCKRGPDEAEVDNVAVKNLPPRSFDGFSIER